MKKNIASLLKDVLDTIEKQFGKGSIMLMSDETARSKLVPAISSGALGLDMALGIGGYPRGRVVEIYGHESSGKTTLSLHAIAELQKSGGVAAFIDAEHAFDINYAHRLGVVTDNLLVSQPDCGEQALDIAEILVRSGAIDLIVVDSVAALVPRAEIDGEMGDNHLGLQARLMSRAMRKLTALANKNQTTLIFINQLRMKIGVMFGNPEVTTGGNALKFYSSVRLEAKRLGVQKQGDVVVGNKIRVKVVKNKMAPPFKQVELNLIYNQGICRTDDLVERAITYEILKKSGSWYSYGDTQLGQGKENTIRNLVKNNNLRQKIEALIINKWQQQCRLEPVTQAA